MSTCSWLPYFCALWHVQTNDTLNHCDFIFTENTVTHFALLPVPCLVCLWRSGTVQSHVSANVVSCGFWCGFGEVAARWNGFWLVITLLLQSLVEQHGKKFADLQVSSLLTNASFHSTLIHSHLALSSCFCPTCTSFSADHMNHFLLITWILVWISLHKSLSRCVWRSVSECACLWKSMSKISVYEDQICQNVIVCYGEQCWCPLVLPSGNTVYALLCHEEWLVKSSGFAWWQHSVCFALH